MSPLKVKELTSVREEGIPREITGRGGRFAKNVNHGASVCGNDAGNVLFSHLTPRPSIRNVNSVNRTSCRNMGMCTSTRIPMRTKESDRLIGSECSHKKKRVPFSSHYKLGSFYRKRSHSTYFTAVAVAR